MKHGFSVAAIAVLLVAGGCTIHPDQENVTRINTFEVVKKIRCETRDSLKHFFFNALDKHPDIVDRLKNDKNYSFAKFNKQRKLNQLRLRKELKDALDRYDGALVAYEFAFTITEENNAGAEVGLFSGFRRGVTKSGLTGSADRSRVSLHSFKVFETFEDSLTKLQDGECLYDSEKNWIYPITGKIDLHPVIEKFFAFTESGTLTGAENTPAYSAKLEFTTRLSGGVKPVMELASLGNSTNVVGANVNFVSIREDKHVVTVVLTLPADKPTPGVTKKQRQINKSLEEFDRIQSITDGQINRQIRDAVKRLPPQ
jgi:hypothetical protein